MTTTDKPATTVTPYDGSMRVPNKHHEIFARENFEGQSQIEAYRRAYPNSRKWKDAGVRVHACRLAQNANVLLRVAWLNSQAVSSKVSTVLERKETLTEIHRGRIANFVTAGADGVVPNVGPENVNSAALRSVKTRVLTSGKGGDQDDIGYVTEIELESKIDAIDKLNKMEGIGNKLELDIISTALKPENLKAINDVGKDLLKKAEKQSGKTTSRK